MLNKVLKDSQKGDFYVHILLQWLQSSLYCMKVLIGVAVVLNTNQTIHSSTSSEHVITRQINQHSLHSKIQRDRFTPWFQGDLQSETEMKRAQDCSCFSALPVLLQAVPTGHRPHECCLPIKRRNTFPSAGFWKSPKANMGMRDELGSNLVLGLLVLYLSSILPLTEDEHHSPQPARQAPHSILATVRELQDRTRTKVVYQREKWFFHRQSWGKNLTYRWTRHEVKLKETGNYDSMKWCWRRKVSKKKSYIMETELCICATQN